MADIIGQTVSAYIALGRLDEARALVKQATEHKVDTLPVHIISYVVAYLQNDHTTMELEAKWHNARPDLPGFAAVQAALEALHGRLTSSRKLRATAVEITERQQRKAGASGMRANTALTEALVGECSYAREFSTGSLSAAHNRQNAPAAAIALALCGDAARAGAIAKELAARFPEDTLLNSVDLAALYAAAELSHHNPQRALEALKPARQFDLGSAQGPLPPITAIYLRGLAYLDARQGPEALAEFQKILAHPGVSPAAVVHALAHLGAARASVLSGDNDKARTAYQDFLAFWKDADPDVPVLQQAKAEYAKLQ